MRKKESLIQKLATDHQMPLSKIKEIVEYQFKFASKIIKEGEFKCVRLPYFGKFSAKKGRIKHIQNGSINNKR